MAPVSPQPVAGVRLIAAPLEGRAVPVEARATLAAEQAAAELETRAAVLAAGATPVEAEAVAGMAGDSGKPDIMGNLSPIDRVYELIPVDRRIRVTHIGSAVILAPAAALLEL
jgi:hypothetical protein